ncbi:MAG TPA: N-acetylglucosamine-6-phosphate deacetylase [Clostridia bacterium]|nr:N-acetylglucosamine-6-phosphate deacetylase [Clostridia bacterium]
MKIAARYIDASGAFVYGEVALEGGVVASARKIPLGAPLDAPYLFPALCDIHTHGNTGCDFSDGEYDGLVAMARTLYLNGVTRFCPATTALPEERLARMCRNAKRLHDNPVKGCARLVGVNLEGPFLSHEKRGAQCESYLQNPDYDLYARLQKEAGGLIKIVCVAPELPGALEFIREVSREAHVSLAHTDCGYDAAGAGFEAGLSHVTHLFNAMRPMHHRAPGPVAAAAERPDVTAELICDGLHVHPSMVRAAYSLFGKDRLCLISDAMAACGLGDGEYELGMQKVMVRGGRAALADGTLAGSTSFLWDCVGNAVAFGIPLVNAVRMASRNPLLVVGEKPSRVRTGDPADFILCTDELKILNIYA